MTVQIYIYHHHNKGSYVPISIYHISGIFQYPYKIGGSSLEQVKPKTIKLEFVASLLSM